MKWRGGNFGHGSLLVTGDGEVLAFGNGRLALLEANPGDTKDRELAKVERLVRDTCYPHLAMAGGSICVKDRSGNVVMLSVRGK